MMSTDWLPGYTIGELDAAQERYDLRFPPDLVALLRERRPANGYDWRQDDERIRWALAHPLDGLLFDLEHNDLWWPEWGERPDRAEERATILTAIVSEAPKLIPLIGHRYLPETPGLAGNPVFSVMQSDVIYYGVNLRDYFEREFNPGFQLAPFEDTAIRHIPFWSEMVERNGLLDGGTMALDL
jgi:hypothetical protein